MDHSLTTGGLIVVSLRDDIMGDIHSRRRSSGAMLRHCRRLGPFTSVTTPDSSSIPRYSHAVLVDVFVSVN